MLRKSEEDEESYKANIIEVHNEGKERSKWEGRCRRGE